MTSRNLGKLGFSALLCLILLIFTVSCVTTTTTTVESLDKIYTGPEDADKAIAYLEKMKGEKDTETSLIYAALLTEKGRMDEARNELLAVLEKDPENTDALYNLALLENYAGNNEDRNRYLDLLLAVDPKNVSGNILRGSVLNTEKKYAQSEKYFLTALKEEPLNVAAMSGLANSYMRTDRLDAAIDILDKAIELYPDNTYLYVDRSKALSAQRKFTSAEKDLTKAIELEPDVEWHYIDRARIRLMQFHEPENALADLKIAESINPDNLFTCYYMAEIYDDLYDFDTAWQYFQKVLTMRPDFYYAYEPVAKIAYMHGDFEYAQEYFQKAYDEYEENPGYILMIYLCLSQQGKIPEGEALLTEKIKKLDNTSIIYEVYRYYLGKTSDYITIDKIQREENVTYRDRMMVFVSLFDILNQKESAGLAVLSTLAGNKGAFEFDLAYWYTKNNTEK